MVDGQWLQSPCSSFAVAVKSSCTEIMNKQTFHMEIQDRWSSEKFYIVLHQGFAHSCVFFFSVLSSAVSKIIIGADLYPYCRAQIMCIGLCKKWAKILKECFLLQLQVASFSAKNVRFKVGHQGTAESFVQNHTDHEGAIEPVAMGEICHFLRILWSHLLWARQHVLKYWRSASHNFWRLFACVSKAVTLISNVETIAAAIDDCARFSPSCSLRVTHVLVI